MAPVHKQNFLSQRLHERQQDFPPPAVSRGLSKNLPTRSPAVAGQRPSGSAEGSGKSVTL
jgi:hypothetical protein